MGNSASSSPSAAEFLAGLPAKRRAFVEEYLKHLNASKAYTQAYGRKGQTAEVNGCKLLRGAKVRAAVDAAIAKRSERTGLDQDDVLRELALLARSSITHYVIDDYGHVSLADDAPAAAMRAVSSIKRIVRADENGNTTVTTELRLWDKVASLQMVGKHLGMFADRLKVEVDLGGLAERLSTARSRAKRGGA